MTKLTYTNVNGYLIPNLTVKSGEQMEQLGKYGFLRRDYMKNHRNSLYQVMLLQDKSESIFWKWIRLPEKGKKSS